MAVLSALAGAVLGFQARGNIGAILGGIFAGAGGALVYMAVRSAVFSSANSDYDMAIARYNLDQMSIRRDERERAEKAQKAALEKAGRMRWSLEQAVAAHRRALEHLVSARAEVIEAKSHRDRRAFTPFWEAVERAVTSLNNHRLMVEAIQPHARNYTEVERELVTAPAGELGLASFDTQGAMVVWGELESLTSISDAPSVAVELSGIVSDAQTDYEFASIFEQRRTTSAVVQGFQSLSQAIEGMASTISSSINRMHAGLLESQMASQAVLKDLASSSSHIDGALSSPMSGTLIEEVRQLNATVRDHR